MSEIYSLEEIKELQAAYKKASTVNRSNQQILKESKVKQKPKISLISALLNWLTQ